MKIDPTNFAPAIKTIWLIAGTAMKAMRVANGAMEKYVPKKL
jgi:hypothetical protein